MKKIIAVIPARYQSSRFPGKPLVQIAGKSMIQRVYERVKEVSAIFEVLVATDDQRIVDEVVSFGGKAVMTGECSCGTERVYEAVLDIECDIVINVQGDEPLINKEMLQDLINAFEDGTVEVATLKKEIQSKRDIDDPNVVKVVTNQKNNAIYFSRCAIPYDRERIGVTYYRHMGIYAYSKLFLEKYVKLPKSSLEISESLEQLRVLDNGYDIRVVETKYESIGVDLPEHVALVERMLENENKI